MIEHINKFYFTKVQEITKIGKQQLRHDPHLWVSDSLRNAKYFFQG